MTPEVGFLLDVDNTLVGNDRIIVDLLRHLESEFGVANSDRYWAIFEGLHEELGYADHLGALQRHRNDAERGADHPRLLLMSGFLVDHPFADRPGPRCVFTEDVDHRKRMASRVETGLMWVNNFDWSATEMPVGGINSSRHGRELGGIVIQEYVNKTLSTWKRWSPIHHHGGGCSSR